MAKRSAKLRQSVTVLGTVVASLMTTNPGHAAELKVLSPQAMKPALNDLIPQFERSSGNQVTISYSSTSALVTEIQDGKMADIAILDPKQIEQLEDDGKIIGDSVVPIAKLAFGVIIRKGATKPDVRTVHGLKQALINAKSIASGDPGSSASGRYLANLIERLKIADAIKPKIKTFSSGTAAQDAVANGEADLAIWVISSANGPGTELAGVLPAQAKKFNSYAAGILTNSNQISAAKALSSFISSVSCIFAERMTAMAPTTSNQRKYRLPCLVILRACLCRRSCAAWAPVRSRQQDCAPMRTSSSRRSRQPGR